MGDLTVRRQRGITGPRYQAAEKTEKAAASGKSQPAVRTAGATVSETLQRLLSRIGQVETHTRESRRTLQSGEAVLAEVQDALGRMAELARKAAGGDRTDRAALQAELERLAEEIDRMTGGAYAGGLRLFLDGELELADGVDAPADVLPGEEEPLLPNWLLRGMCQKDLTSEQVLSMLGLSRDAGIADILAALSQKTPESEAASAYLAALYMGAAIAGDFKNASLPDALEGLRQFMEKISQGVSPDQALEQLTGGAFTSLAELEAQFSDGTAPGMDIFLSTLLLYNEDAALLSESSLLSLLAGMEGVELDLMMGLLDAVQNSGLEAGMESAAGENLPSDSAPNAVLELAEGTVTGRDLSGITVDEASGALTVSGRADTMIQGTGQTIRDILLTGTGTVTLREVQAAGLTAAVPGASVSSPEETLLEELQLRPGASLTLSGGGLVRLGGASGGAGSFLRLSGGAVIVTAEDGEIMGALSVPVVMDGPALLAARAVQVTSASGKAMAPFDLVWKTLLPGWSEITSLTVDGRQARTALISGEPARLWLEKGGKPSQDSPIHPVVIRGRDKLGRSKVRYAYLRWNENAKAFQEAVMYPNPFTVSGGEAGQDWVYEEESHTLRILTDRVSAVSGGEGVDAKQAPFSGRLALADGIGLVELTLNGVVCQVNEGGAFTLGRENQVTLLLRSGTRNLFQSGDGWAGISLGEGTSLRIDCPEARSSTRNPAGALSASAGAGGAGIGRDSGGGRERTGSIEIRGGSVTAVGASGGAGIGAGRRGAIGPVGILGGIVSATGAQGGGAGIGGALEGTAGDISIRGGSVTAQAIGHAAAIGAGAQGSCGDILITGAAKIKKALGGDPGADIGACLFGGCGKVRIDGGADIGRAQLWTRSGIPLQMGAETVTLPQFRLSSRTLGLDRLSLAKREAAQAAQTAIERDRRWVSQIQNAYHVLYHRLERGISGILGAQQFLGPVRDNGAAGTLLADTRSSLPSSQAARIHGKRGKEDVRQLLR